MRVARLGRVWFGWLLLAGLVIILSFLDRAVALFSIIIVIIWHLLFFPTSDVSGFSTAFRDTPIFPLWRDHGLGTIILIDGTTCMAFLSTLEAGRISAVASGSEFCLSTSSPFFLHE